jgi:hypothetical protein
MGDRKGSYQLSAWSLQQQVVSGHCCSEDNGMIPPVGDSFSFQQEFKKLTADS